MLRTRAIRQVRAQRTRTQLLEAARSVFADRGYAGATIDDVAKAAGVSKGAYYFHFATKEDVLNALIHEWTADVSERLGQLVASGAELGQIVQALVSSSLDWKPSLLIEFWAQAERSPRVAEGLIEAQQAWRAAALKAVRAAQRAGLVAGAVSTESAVGLLHALRDGLIAQAALPGSNREADRFVVRAAIALLQPAPPPLRRTG